MKPFSSIEEKISDNLRSEADDQIEGLEEIGWGFDRTSYRIKTEKYGEAYRGKVIKIGSRGKNARTANRKEFETWMALENDKGLKKHFCPIRDRGENFRWIIMDYARPIKSLFSRLKSRKKQKLVKKRLEDVEENLDLKHENLGYHSERGIVFIDYPWGGNFVSQEKNEKGLRKLLSGLGNL
jgi:hypothetical protein